jgi:hypothetical protein
MRRVFLAFVAASTFASAAAASERRFTYTYESGVMRPGAWEIEPWSTFRLGKSDFYSRFDSRIEAELGLTDRLQTALYLNMKAVSADTPLGRVSETELQGISSEWKLKLADPVADRAGVALYGELSAGPAEVELEAKLILDKRVGRFLGALNVVAEREWEFEQEGTEKETIFEVDAAACWFLTPRLTAGLELRSHTVFLPDEEPTRSALFLGPTVAYARERWWVAASVLPQVTALAGASDGGLDLEEHERVEVRVLFGLEF